MTAGESVSSQVLDWLLKGDPAVRWQVHRDLLNSNPAEVEQERAKIQSEGFGKRLLALQSPDGRWSADQGAMRYRGLYGPKWTSTFYTLLLLARLGLPAGNDGALRGCRALAAGAEWFESGGLGYFVSRRSAEQCASGLALAIFGGFGAEPDACRDLERYLLDAQFEDGGWNCDLNGTHSSFHTTMCALEGLATRTRTESVETALRRGREFLLAHKLYCSHRTGEVVHPMYTRLRWSVGWQIDVLRALDHFSTSGVSPDPRLGDAIDLVKARRRPDGRWMATQPQSGKLHFRLETPRTPSRWITQRCLRALKWWEGRGNGSST